MNVLITLDDHHGAAHDAPVSGTVESVPDRGRPVSFSGWLQLINVLESMVASRADPGD